MIVIQVRADFFVFHLKGQSLSADTTFFERMFNPCLSAFRIAGIYLPALYDGDPIKRHSIFLASDLLVSPRGIVLCKCTDWGLNKRWRGGGAEDAKDERAGGKGTFQSSDFPEYMGVKSVGRNFFLVQSQGGTFKWTRQSTVCLFPA